MCELICRECGQIQFPEPKVELNLSFPYLFGNFIHNEYIKKCTYDIFNPIKYNIQDNIGLVKKVEIIFFIFFYYPFYDRKGQKSTFYDQKVI